MHSEIVSKGSVKGQIEILIFAIVIIGALIIFLAVQPGSIVPPTNGPDVGILTGPIRDFVINSVRTEADDVLVTLETHGGYIDVPGENPIFLFQEIPVWQACEDVFIPTLTDIETRFEREIFNYIKGSEEIESGVIDGKNIVFDKNAFSQQDVSVNIYENEIEVDIALPTRVDGFPTPETYNFRIPSVFGRIYKFASDFSHQAAKEQESGGRFFEKYFNYCLIFSELVPTRDSLNECGVYSFSGEDVTEGLYLCAFASTRLDMWEQPGNQDPGDPPKYAVPSVGENDQGNVYDELEISFHLTDDYEVELEDDIIIPNTEETFCGPIPLFCTPDECGPAFYNIAYDLTYPVIIRVRDPYGDYFNFASIVSIEEDLIEGEVDVDRIAAILTSGLEDLAPLDLGENSIYLLDRDGLEIPESLGDPVTDTSDLVLRDFKVEDGLCWDDGDGDGQLSYSDLLYLKIDAGCRVGDQWLTNIEAQRLGLKYSDGNENNRYDSGEPLYYDARKAYEEGFVAGTEQLRSEVGQAGFMWAITTAAESVTDTVPARNCGFGD